MWIVIAAIWVYNMTVATGHFAVLRRSFGAISDDQRVQAVIIAFCFGALLEALAGFGTPVAITSVMLIALGFQPIKAASVALVANTAPVAFGAIAIPITTLGETTGIPADDLGAMVGRQTPFLALIVPLILVGMVDGRRGVRQTWPVALIGGLTFAFAQFACSNYISIELTDIVASLLATATIVGLSCRSWQPAEPLVGRGLLRALRPRRPWPAAPCTDAGRWSARWQRRDDTTPGLARLTWPQAYAPYLIIIAVFSHRADRGREGRPGRGAVDHHVRLARAWTCVNPDGEALASVTFNLNWLPATGTLMLISGLITMAVARDLSPARAVRTFVRDARPAQVGDPHRGIGARPGLRDEPVGPDGDARPLGRGRGRHLRVPVGPDRLARRGRDRVGHVLQRPLRRPSGERRQGRRAVADAHRRGQQLRRRAREDDLAPEPGDRRRGRGHGGPGGRPLP